MCRILNVNNQWYLELSRTNGQVIRVLTFKKLIHAIDAASTLQLHVDNINELPISQYAIQSRDGIVRWTA